MMGFLPEIAGVSDTYKVSDISGHFVDDGFNLG